MEVNDGSIKESTNTVRNTRTMWVCGKVEGYWNKYPYQSEFQMMVHDSKTRHLRIGSCLNSEYGKHK